MIIYTKIVKDIAVMITVMICIYGCYKIFYLHVNKDIVKYGSWEYDEGYGMGDIIYFDSVKSDTTTWVDTNNYIHHHGRIEGKVLRATTNHLIIVSKDGRKGYYGKGLN